MRSRELSTGLQEISLSGDIAIVAFIILEKKKFSQKTKRKQTKKNCVSVSACPTKGFSHIVKQ